MVTEAGLLPTCCDIEGIIRQQLEDKYLDTDTLSEKKAMLRMTECEEL